MQSYSKVIVICYVCNYSDDNSITLGNFNHVVHNNNTVLASTIIIELVDSVNRDDTDVPYM